MLVICDPVYLVKYLVAHFLQINMLKLCYYFLFYSLLICVFNRSNFRSVQKYNNIKHGENNIKHVKFDGVSSISLENHNPVKL